MKLEFIFVKDPGVIGYISKKFNNTVVAKYYLDGIAYSVSLEKDEYYYFYSEEELDE